MWVAECVPKQRFQTCSPLILSKVVCKKSIFLKHQRSKVHRSAVKVLVEERRLLWPEPIWRLQIGLEVKLLRPSSCGCLGQSTLQFGCFGYSCSVAVSASCSVAVSARDSMHRSMTFTGVLKKEPVNGVRLLVYVFTCHRNLFDRLFVF